MSMPFALKSAQQAAGLKVGDPVVFSFSEGASGVVVEKIARRAGAGNRRRHDDRRADPLVGGNRFLVLLLTVFVAAAGVWAVRTTPIDALARPVGRAGHHPHQLPRPGAADRREPGHLSAGHHHAGRAGRDHGARLTRSSATASSTCCSKTAPTCTGRARACWST
jgi:hypothetical protein